MIPVAPPFHRHQLIPHKHRLYASDKQSILLVALLAQLLNEPCRIVDSRKRAPSSHDALVHEVSRDDDPKSVHQDEVAPVVELLGTGV
jgi:hypothetical protein